ncbi:hypothetical protein, partial [Streptomyces sp. NPDC058296]|uniref:hypothetical protein n=1 Tax=Streptomyces sp. NPDC058296 TaxID=3346432 RepID=UPI0036F05164
RVTDTAAGLEVDGTQRPVPATAWALSNGLVNVVPTASAGVLDVQAYTDAAWRSKLWSVTIDGSGVAAWDSATLLRNDPEHVVLRLTASRSPGRATLDLALRRGSRFVEGYLQTGTSATLAVYRSTLETNTSFAASGYVTATNDDADGNKFACGSARNFTAHTNGGITKSSATSLDFWIGAIASQTTLNTNPTFETDATGWTTTNARAGQIRIMVRAAHLCGRGIAARPVPPQLRRHPGAELPGLRLAVRARPHSDRRRRQHQLVRRQQRLPEHLYELDYASLRGLVLHGRQLHRPRQRSLRQRLYVDERHPRGRCPPVWRRPPAPRSHPSGRGRRRPAEPVHRKFGRSHLRGEEVTR